MMKLTKRLALIYDSPSLSSSEDMFVGDEIGAAGSIAFTASSGVIAASLGALKEELRLRRPMRKAETSSGRATEPARAGASCGAVSEDVLRGASGIPAQHSGS